jgi:hypothetical protein
MLSYEEQCQKNPAVGAPPDKSKDSALRYDWMI